MSTGPRTEAGRMLLHDLDHVAYVYSLAETIAAIENEAIDALLEGARLLAELAA